MARSKEEIDAEINAMRDEDEQRMREIEAIGRLPQGKKSKTTCTSFLTATS